MRKHQWPLVWLVVGALLAIATLLLPLGVTAQAGAQTVINFIQSVDTPDKFGVTLKVFFTLTDATQQPITSAQVTSAKFTLPDDNLTVDAKVSKANGPINMVLVLDASGTMFNFLKNVQQAAISMVNSAPQDSQFAVIRFSDKIETIQEFTADRNRVVNAIGTIKAFGTTCLYDAAFQGVQLMGNAPQSNKDNPSNNQPQPDRRRAVIVFSGNKDATYNKPCSKHSVADVVSLATTGDNRTPVYTIGFRSFAPLSEGDLRTIADATGGTTTFGNNPQSLFNDIVNSLNAQFIAEGLVTPKAGERSFSLRLALASGSSPNDVSARFVSPKDYSTPPTITPTITATPLPPAVDIISLQQDPATKEFVIEISAVSEQLIGEYRFDLISPTGTLQSQVSKPAPITNPVRIPIGKLDDGEYSIRVSAIGKNGQLLARSADQRIRVASTPTITPTVTGTPLPISARIVSVQYQDPAVKDKIVVKLNILSPEQIARLHAILANADTGVTEKEFANIKVAPEVVLDLAGVPAGDYNITLYAFGASGQQLDQSTQKFKHTYEAPTPTLTPTPKPDDFVSQLGEAIRDPSKSPVVIIAVIAVVGGLIALMAVLVLRKPKKAATGTGFLREMTGAVDVSELAGHARNRTPPGGVNVASAGKPPAKQARDYDKTQAVPYTNMPDSTLAVEKSRDTPSVGKVIPLTHVPFTMGRRERDLNFENDPGVSREHAQITYENNVFYITDNGSTNHTFVDDVEVPAGVAKPLYSGATIRLGTSTVLKFRTVEAGGYDMDKTSPEPFKRG
jgi:Mg-chelatase subunit ChlD